MTNKNYPGFPLLHIVNLLYFYVNSSYSEYLYIRKIDFNLEHISLMAELSQAECYYTHET